jgi:peptidoglycan hydrolase-like protein with peptidoglycan-binding domain
MMNLKKTAATAVLVLAGTTLAALPTGPASAAPTQDVRVATCQRDLGFYPTLSPGAQGRAVRALQCFLNDAGAGPVAVDGNFGPQTKRAVLAVVRRWHPSVTSARVTPKRWVTIISATLPSTKLRRGDSGRGVRVLQEALNSGRLGADVTLTVDGSFGAQTEGFLKEWQRQNGLVRSGVTDRPTRHLLHLGATVSFEG